MTLPGPLAGVILLIDALITVSIGVVILKRNINETLNQLISIALFSFTGYLCFRALVFLLPLSMLSLFDLFRDLSLTGAIIASFLGGLSGLYAYKGLEFIKQIKVVGTLIPLTIIAIIVGNLNDHIVYNSQLDMLNNQTSLFGMIGVFIIPLVLMSIAAISYFATFLTIEPENPMHKKALILPIGLMIITLGIAYSAIIAAIGYPPNILTYLGDVFFITGSVFLFFAFR
ncbi:MAG: hypothetical protein ACFFC7_24140 [Candidatus Hermodarchaeota archaeon]